jgi:hypothetical protein
LGEATRTSHLREQFRLEAIPHLVDYWDNSDDNEKIVLTAAALLEQTTRPGRDFSLADLHRLFARSEPTVQHLERRGMLMFDDERYRLFSSTLGPWILSQITAELSEEQSYHDWLAENRGSVERVTGKQGGLLKEILPKIRTNYRQLIITWASDPRTLVAVVGLLKNVLAVVN